MMPPSSNVATGFNVASAWQRRPFGNDVRNYPGEKGDRLRSPYLTDEIKTVAQARIFGILASVQNERFVPCF
jgi:hypothetical protein